MRPALWLAVSALVASSSAQAFPGAPSHAAFESWQKVGANRAQARALRDYLKRFGVEDVFPIEQLLRTSTTPRCQPRFEVPPALLWPRVVTTLRFAREKVLPLIGPAEIVSAYRNPDVNACAGGARSSAHRGFWGFDLVPTSGISQAQLFARLCRLHAQEGQSARFGLGFYGGTRFHVDTWRYRRWGANNRSGTSPCG